MLCLMEQPSDPWASILALEQIPSMFMQEDNNIDVFSKKFTIMDSDNSSN